MSAATENTPAVLQDQYDSYYTEKLWAWIPEVYRARDGEPEQGGVLRAIVESFGKRAAETRRSIDRLWENQDIESCDDEFVPAIAGLLGTEMLRSQNKRGRRTTTAKTIFYRRFAGTLRVVESLLRDITPWDGAVVEAFKRLGRTWHGLEPLSESGLGVGFFKKGLLTGTPGGGTTDLRNPHGGDLITDPFDEFSHTLDARRLSGLKGRYAIEKVNYHYYRYQPYRVEFATPFDLGIAVAGELGAEAETPSHRFTFDPSGRDIQLFRPSQRLDDTGCRLLQEWEIAAAINCRLLADARYQLSRIGIEEVAEELDPSAQDQLISWTGTLFKNEDRLLESIESVDGVSAALNDERRATILKESLTDDSAKGHLWPLALAVEIGPSSGGEGLGHEEMLPAILTTWGDNFNGSGEKRVAVDPERGRFLLLDELAANEEAYAPVYYYGALTELGAGPYDRRQYVIDGGTEVAPDLVVSGQHTHPGPLTGLNLGLEGNADKAGLYTFKTSKTYLPELQQGGADENVITNITQLAWQADNGERPYVLFKPHSNAGSLTFRAKAKEANPANPDDNLRCLTLDGLWLGIEPGDLGPIDLVDGKCPPREAKVIIEGVWDRILIRNCTLDPGGQRAQTIEGKCTPIPYLKIEIAAGAIVEELIIDNSVTGPVVTVDPALQTVCALSTLRISDSIVQNIESQNDPDAHPAISAGAIVHLHATTIEGDVIANQLQASDSLVYGRITVVDEQHSCFRYSYGARKFGEAIDGQSTATPFPHRYESIVADKLADSMFVSTEFGHPGYFQLTSHVSEAISRGASNNVEMGVYNREITPILLDDLRDKLEEFSPDGVVIQLIDETAE